jgi:hypothetical protein
LQIASLIHEKACIPKHFAFYCSLLQDSASLKTTAKQSLVLHPVCAVPPDQGILYPVSFPIMSETEVYDSILLNVGAQNQNHIKLATTQLTFHIPSSASRLTAHHIES